MLGVSMATPPVTSPPSYGSIKSPPSVKASVGAAQTHVSSTAQPVPVTSAPLTTLGMNVAPIHAGTTATPLPLILRTRTADPIAGGLPTSLGPSTASTQATNLSMGQSFVSGPSIPLSTGPLLDTRTAPQSSTILTTHALPSYSSLPTASKPPTSTLPTIPQPPIPTIPAVQPPTLPTSQHPTLSIPTSQIPASIATSGSQALPQTSATPTQLTNQNAPIQPGVPTPLPPGLNLETLGVLCRLPESDLLKLKLPAGLLTAIKVWKMRQQKGKMV